MFNDHQLREHAYYIWEKEGRRPGDSETYWHRAQAELQAVASQSAAATSPAKALVKKAAKPTAGGAKASPKAAAAGRKSPRAADADAAALH